MPASILITPYSPVGEICRLRVMLRGSRRRRNSLRGNTRSVPIVDKSLPAVPCYGKFHLPRASMPGCKTSCHEIIAEISFVIFFLFIKSLWVLPFLPKISYFDAHRIYVMEPMRILAILIQKMQMILPVFRLMTSIYTVTINVGMTVSVAYGYGWTTAISLAIPTWRKTVKWDQRKTPPLATFRLTNVGGCAFLCCARNLTQTGHIK